MHTPFDLVHRLLTAPLEPESRQWLDQSLGEIRQSGAALAQHVAEAARRVGRGPLIPPTSATASPPALPPVLPIENFQLPLNHWRRSDAARACLLFADADRDPAHALSRAADLYFDAAGADDRTSLVRVFALLPGANLAAGLLSEAPPIAADPATEDGRTKAVRAICDALRTNVAPLFDAATAENPFFSAVVPELEFNKGVLKRVFLGMPLDAVLGLQSRANAELSRMLLNLAEEREISYRPYPPEVWPVIAGHPTPGLLAKLIGLIEHPDDAMRAAAADGLAVLADAACVPFVENRRSRERQQPVMAALDRAVAAAKK